ncbi:MAG TPA: tripartite tricarboxylate transporter TctB family protein [Candidatus Binatia bacterium]
MASPAHNPKDFWTGLIYVAFGAAFIWIARDYGMGTAFRMGPAYFPTVLGAILILIGLISLARSFLRPGTAIAGFTIKGMLIVVLSTALFGAIVRGAGLAVALPALVIVSGYASADFRWGRMLALAAGVTVFCVLVFLKGLGVPLPVVGPWLGGG